MKRTIRIEFNDGTPPIDLELSKAAAIKCGSVSLMHLDQLNDGTWRLIYNGEMIPDFTKVDGFKIIRED